MKTTSEVTDLVAEARFLLAGAAKIARTAGQVTVHLLFNASHQVLFLLETGLRFFKVILFLLPVMPQRNFA